MITRPNNKDYDEMLDVWEASVRSSHSFLTEDDIIFYKPLIRYEYFLSVDLYVIRNNAGRIAAFLGLSRNMIEMLFVHPEEQGRGYGKELMVFAVKEKSLLKVDVNEQNIFARGFYEHLGFRVASRDEKDSIGKPFPILHMEYTPCLYTERTLLRPFCSNDLESLFLCCRNPKLGNNAGWKPHESIEESYIILHEYFMKQPSVWAIVRDEALIGSVGLVPDPKRNNPYVRMLGYWLCEEEWGKGYMSEVVSQIIEYGYGRLELSLITANCYPENQRSKSLLLRQGFVSEATLHQAELTYDGRVLDHECFYLPKR